MNVIGMKHIKGQREVMHVYVRRERVWRLATERVVPMRGGRGRGRAHCAHGEGTSQENTLGPLYEPHMIRESRWRWRMMLSSMWMWSQTQSS